MRTHLALQTGGFADRNYSEDWPLATGLSFRGEIDLDPNPGRLYRIHEESLVNQGQAAETILSTWQDIPTRVRRDPAASKVVGPLMPLAGAWRRLDAWRRTHAQGSAHEDIFRVLGRYRLSDGTPSQEEVAGLMRQVLDDYQVSRPH